MSNLSNTPNNGFYIDAENCIGCRTCQVACKDVHDLPVGTNYREVRTFVTGSGFTPRMYHIAIPVKGCDLCASLRTEGEEMACVSSCLQRVIEFGDLKELEEKHAREPLGSPAALKGARPGGPAFIMRLKDCMEDESYQEIIV